MLHILKVVGTCNLSRISAYGPLELPSTLGIRPHLGAEGLGSTRESRNTHTLELHCHVLLTERDADRLAFVESF